MSATLDLYKHGNCEHNNWIVCWERRALAWPGVVINKPIGGAREEEGGANACT